MMSYASSSTSTTRRLSKGYDVFLSFRGEDTRTGFTCHLYDALIRKRIKTFLDDESLHAGDFIAPALLEAIEASRFAVVILSSDFATSKWCLEEISKVVDCMERGKLIVIPVFYHVSPSDVRHQRNCFEQGFANHEKDPAISPEKVATWRSAFTKVGLIKGWHLTQDRKESEIIREISNRILQEMQDALPVDLTRGLVGIEARVKEVIRILNMESSEVCFIGICGMSGIGKTTLAEVVFQVIQNKFQESSFIENIKDISKDHNSDLCKLQQKLLDDVLKDESIPVRSVKHGQTLLMTKLRDLKVLIVLDDVNHADQFRYLAGEREWFGPATRVIVTTTNRDLLNAYDVKEIFMCEELKGEEALSLFCQSAFQDEHPAHGYEKLSDDIVRFAGGLPIALTVYGSLLCGKEEKYWKGILNKVQEYPHKEVLGRLEVGYVRLDRDQQLTFMYIACFLKGRNIDLVKDMLTNIGLYPECGITDLINKFLITIKFDDCVWMHDLLQKMCWEILRKELQQYNGKQIAIKYRQDVLDILSFKPKESRTIEIINQEPYKVEVAGDCIDDPSCFSKMRKLKFLRISNIHFPQGLNYLSNDLRILEWPGCSLKSLPSMFEPIHIYQLEMCYSQLVTLWEKDLDLPNLRSIDLSFSKDLTKIPNLSSTQNLVKLNLEGCTQLKELHQSVLSHKRLEYVNLCGCTHLQSLGGRNMEMDALVTLLLSRCSNLEYIPEFGQNMKCLEHLYVDATGIKKLPESLGGLCNLRKLDASGTSIKEIPLSVRCLNRLRLLCVRRCQLSSKTSGFLFTKMDMLSGLRELDLSYCNLSVVPDCIGLLHRLVNLDLSGNDLASLPANISLLSNLRMLCLNNCMRLQSLPKLSVVNEDTLYGLPMRFHYVFSVKRVDVSKFHAASNNTSPVVSCLNCPKVAENESGGHLAERILSSYLQLRSKYWITPEAVFEIVGVGSKIPSGFKLPRADEILTLRGPWIGVVICAVVALHHIDAAMETKYVVTAHVHVGEKHWRIPVPISFLAAGLESQLVFYWTRPDDLQRTIDSGQINSFKFSFSVEPQDYKLQVTEFGVRFIRKQDVVQLKKLESSATAMVRRLFGATFSPALRWYKHSSDASTSLLFCQSSINHDLIKSIMSFFCDYGKEQYALVDMQKTVKRLIEINQEVLCECKEEWSHTELFPLFYEYYRIINGTFEVYNDLLRLLKDASDNWLSVKLALEQILAKGRTDKDYSYREMLEQLNDLETSEGIRFCNNFITKFVFFCKRTVVFSRHLHEEIHDIKKFKSVNTLEKVSTITIAGIISILATYMCTDKLSQGMKSAGSYFMWLHLIHSLLNNMYRRFPAKEIYGRELRIWEFLDCAIVVQELKMKMARFASFTHQNEKEMIVSINKLEKMVDNISVTIENMYRHAHLYSLDISDAGITLNQFITDSNLQLSVTGVRFTPPCEEEQFGSPVSEAMTIMYRATLSLIHTGLQWYIYPCEEKDADSSRLLSCYSSIHDTTNNIIKEISSLHYLTCYSLDYVHTLITCLHSINQEGFTVLSECKEEWRHHPHLFHLVNDYHRICLQTSRLYNDFVRSLKGQCDIGLGVILRLKEVVVNFRQENAYQNYREVILGFDNDDGGFTLSGDFMKSLAYLCKQTVGFTRQFNEDILELKLVKVLAKVSSGLIAGVISVMSVYMVELEYLHWMEEKPLTSLWLHVNRCFSWESPLMKIGRMVKNDFLGIDFHLKEVKGKIMSFLDDVKYQSEERFVAYKKEIMLEIDRAAMNIDKLSVIIEEMSRHADTINEDIMKAGISLELISDNHMLPVKRKRSPSH